MSSKWKNISLIISSVFIWVVYWAQLSVPLPFAGLRQLSHWHQCHKTSDTRQASLWLLFLFSCYGKTQELVSFGQLILPTTGIAQKLLPLNKVHLSLIWSWSETLPLCLLYCFPDLSFESLLKYHSVSFYLQLRTMPQLPQEHWVWNLLTLTLKPPLRCAMAVF